eukprot:2622731-Rhodomonas_salina.1
MWTGPHVIRLFGYSVGIVSFTFCTAFPALKSSRYDIHVKKSTRVRGPGSNRSTITRWATCEKNSKPCPVSGTSCSRSGNQKWQSGAVTRAPNIPWRSVLSLFQVSKNEVSESASPAAAALFRALYCVSMSPNDIRVKLVAIWAIRSVMLMVFMLEARTRGRKISSPWGRAAGARSFIGMCCFEVAGTNTLRNGFAAIGEANAGEGLDRRNCE